MFPIACDERLTEMFEGWEGCWVIRTSGGVRRALFKERISLTHAFRAAETLIRLRTVLCVPEVLFRRRDDDHV